MALASHLRPEKSVVELVHHFRSARSDLLKLIRSTRCIGNESSASNELAPSVPTTVAASKKIISNKVPYTVKKLAQPHFYKQSRESVKSALERLTEGSTVHIRADGDKEALERRYKDFVHINNAQLDAPNPLSVEQIVAEVHRRENARITEAKRAIKTSSVVEAMRNGQVNVLILQCTMKVVP